VSVLAELASSQYRESRCLNPKGIGWCQAIYDSASMSNQSYHLLVAATQTTQNIDYYSAVQVYLYSYGRKMRISSRLRSRQKSDAGATVQT